MEVRTISDLRRFTPEKMQKLSVFATPRLFLDVYCLEPGQGQKPHVHPDSDKIYVVLEGRGRFQIGGEAREVGAGQAVIAPAGVEHGAENGEKARLVMLVAMAPPPPHA
jgi:quercetin dioxygenase-like cupin family protein